MLLLRKVSGRHVFPRALRPSLPANASRGHTCTGSLLRSTSKPPQGRTNGNHWRCPRPWTSVGKCQVVVHLVAEVDRLMPIPGTRAHVSPECFWTSEKTDGRRTTAHYRLTNITGFCEFMLYITDITTDCLCGAELQSYQQVSSDSHCYTSPDPASY
jgi:hypothetical protein